MLNRRDFLRGAVGTLAAFNALSSFSWGATDKKPADLKYPKTEPRSNIFCLFDDAALKEAVEGLVRDSGCDIWYGDHGDMIAVPSCIEIVDRNLMGEDKWDFYLTYCAEANDNTPCIIVDGMKHLGLPKYKYVSQFDMNDPASIPAIREIIISHLAQPEKWKLWDLKWGSEAV